MSTNLAEISTAQCQLPLEENTQDATLEGPTTSGARYSSRCTRSNGLTEHFHEPHSLDGEVVAQLPLYNRVVFVDWSGVLSSEPFWSSILNNLKHPLHESMCRATEDLWHGNAEMLRSWMRGSLTSEAIVEQFNISLDRRFRDDYLLRRLHDDCRRLKCNPKLVTELRAIRRDTFIILATDNMDCFWHSVSHMPELRSFVDSILCSSAIGALKKDSVEHFFRPWLNRHGLTFDDALLLDDTPDICEGFVAAGGTAVVVDDIDQAILDLLAWDATSRE